jgi:DNA polymerase III delta prime subunit
MGLKPDHWIRKMALENRIIEPLHSRCSVIDFTIPKDSKVQMAAEFFKRVCQILDTEKVEFDKKVVAEVIQSYFPDFRRVLNELQRYSATGKIDSGIFVSKDTNINDLVELLKNKKFPEMRKWVAQNSDIDTAALYRKLYDVSANVCKPQSVPQLIVTLADYQYKSAFVADQEINNVACFTELMMDVEWL